MMIVGRRRAMSLVGVALGMEQVKVFQIEPAGGECGGIKFATSIAPDDRLHWHREDGGGEFGLDVIVEKQLVHRAAGEGLVGG